MMIYDRYLILSSVIFFLNFNDEEKLKFIITCESFEMIRDVAKIWHDILKKRQLELYHT